jgi:DNA recombination protein RmuC
MVLLAAALGAGFLLGMLVVYLSSRGAMHRMELENAVLKTRLQSADELSNEREATLAHAEQRLAAKFGQLARASLASNSATFLQLAKENLGRHQTQATADLTARQKAVEELVTPIRDALDRTRKQINDIENVRHESFGGIKAQLEAMTASQALLRTETRNLVKALRRPEVRGQWGEITLRRIAELAGMVEHCDFVEQAHTATQDGSIRPDMVVRLPDRGEIVIDVKTPLDAYLEAVEAPDDQARKLALQRHARNVADRVRELATKAYWSQFDRSPEFVILFIPGDQFLSAALAEQPGLLEEALGQKVVLATPTSLVALLKAIAYGWRQLALADNAEEIRRLAEDLYTRVGAFSSHLARLGKQLEGSVKAYNSAVGSLERKVLPGARKFVELGVHARKPIETLTEVETATREVSPPTENIEPATPDRPQPEAGKALKSPDPDPEDLVKPH